MPLVPKLLLVSIPQLVDLFLEVDLLLVARGVRILAVSMLDFSAADIRHASQMANILDDVLRALA